MINGSLKPQMDRKTGMGVGKIKIVAKMDAKANHKMDGNRTANSQTANSRMVNSTRAAARTETANKRPAYKPLRPLQAAARPEGITVSSAPNCANGCRKPKTSAATWGRIVIWQTT